MPIKKVYPEFVPTVEYILEYDNSLEFKERTLFHIDRLNLILQEPLFDVRYSDLEHYYKYIHSLLTTDEELISILDNMYHLEGLFKKAIEKRTDQFFVDNPKYLESIAYE